MARPFRNRANHARGSLAGSVYLRPRSAYGKGGPPSLVCVSLCIIYSFYTLTAATSVCGPGSRDNMGLALLGWLLVGFGPCMQDNQNLSGLTKPGSVLSRLHFDRLLIPWTMTPIVAVLTVPDTLQFPHPFRMCSNLQDITLQVSL